MARAIPTRFLVHNCILKKSIKQNRDRNTVYSQTVLKQVRIGATFQSVRGAYGEVKTDTLTLLIDYKNTIYETMNGDKTEKSLPEEKDVIEWQGKSFTVRGVTPCYTKDDTPHHWEVTLE